jgi:hypothetical protein
MRGERNRLIGKCTYVGNMTEKRGNGRYRILYCQINNA